MSQRVSVRVVLIGGVFHVPCDGVVIVIYGESVSSRCYESVECLVKSYSGELFHVECGCKFVFRDWHNSLSAVLYEGRCCMREGLMD